MSLKPATAKAPGRLSQTESPSPLLSDVPPRNAVYGVSNEAPLPPSDVPDVEETEPPTVLDNPLITDDTGQPEAEETKEDSNNDGGTTTTISTAPSHVTECATVYSVLMAFVSTGYTALYAYYARTGDEKVYKFWTAIILPISTTAMAISFALKPRRQDQAYKVFLVLQYVLFTLVTEILSLVGDDFAESVLIKASL